MASGKAAHEIVVSTHGFDIDPQYLEPTHTFYIPETFLARHFPHLVQKTHVFLVPFFPHLFSKISTLSTFARGVASGPGGRVFGLQDDEG